MLRKLQDKWKSWHLDRDIKAGRILRGRQPEMTTTTEPIPTLTMRVYRAATDTWEDVN